MLTDAKGCPPIPTPCTGEESLSVLMVIRTPQSPDIFTFALGCHPVLYLCTWGRCDSPVTFYLLTEANCCATLSCCNEKSPGGTYVVPGTMYYPTYSTLFCAYPGRIEALSLLRKPFQSVSRKCRFRMFDWSLVT